MKFKVLSFAEFHSSRRVSAPFKKCVLIELAQGFWYQK